MRHLREPADEPPVDLVGCVLGPVGSAAGTNKASTPPGASGTAAHGTRRYSAWPPQYGPIIGYP